MPNPLINKKYLLQKFPGKGGWTYAFIPEISQNKNSPFGWVKVKGTIDGYEVENCKLLPMGDGKLFFPVNAAIRKAIKKEEGDWVSIILFETESTQEVPSEIWDCLETEPTALSFFKSLPESDRKAYLTWIYQTKKEDERVNRIANMIDRLLHQLKHEDSSKRIKRS